MVAGGVSRSREIPFRRNLHPVCREPATELIMQYVNLTSWSLDELEIPVSYGPDRIGRIACGPTHERYGGLVPSQDCIYSVT